LGLNSEETSSSPKDDDLDEIHEAILLALSDEPFSSVRQMADGRWQMPDGRCQMPDGPQDMRSKKLNKLDIVGLSILCISQSDIRHQTSDIRHQTSDIRHQTSDIFIGFITSSPTVRRQVEASCRSNIATSCCPSGVKDRMAMRITYVNP
jgi:hypothetical protein